MTNKRGALAYIGQTLTTGIAVGLFFCAVYVTGVVYEHRHQIYSVQSVLTQACNASGAATDYVKGNHQSLLKSTSGGKMVNIPVTRAFAALSQQERSKLAATCGAPVTASIKPWRIFVRQDGDGDLIGYVLLEHRFANHTGRLIADLIGADGGFYPQRSHGSAVPKSIIGAAGAWRMSASGWPIRHGDIMIYLAYFGSHA